MGWPGRAWGCGETRQQSQATGVTSESLRPRASLALGALACPAPGALPTPAAPSSSHALQEGRAGTRRPPLPRAHTALCSQTTGQRPQGAGQPLPTHREPVRGCCHPGGRRWDRDGGEEGCTPHPRRRRPPVRARDRQGALRGGLLSLGSGQVAVLMNGTGDRLGEDRGHGSTRVPGSVQHFFEKPQGKCSGGRVHLRSRGDPQGEFRPRDRAVALRLLPLACSPLGRFCSGPVSRAMATLLGGHPPRAPCLPAPGGPAPWPLPAASRPLRAPPRLPVPGLSHAFHS